MLHLSLAILFCKKTMLIERVSPDPALLLLFLVGFIYFFKSIWWCFYRTARISMDAVMCYGAPFLGPDEWNLEYYGSVV